MNNGEYWQKRFELLEQAAHQQGVQCYADIEKQYRQAQKQLEGQIAAWYQRFASNNGVTVSVQGTVNFGGKATDTAMVTISTDFNETIRADMDAKAASGVVQVDFIEIKTT